MKAQLTFTYGGLKCDLDSRVLSTTGVPIPGTYSMTVYTPSRYTQVDHRQDSMHLVN